MTYKQKTALGYLTLTLIWTISAVCPGVSPLARLVLGLNAAMMYLFAWATGSVVRRPVRLDDGEVEAILLREYGRKYYYAAGAMKKVRYTGASDEQVAWGGNDDPRGVLRVGEVYEVEREEVHKWHTKYSLKGIEGRFNSVCFEDEPAEKSPAGDQDGR